MRTIGKVHARVRAHTSHGCVDRLQAARHFFDDLAESNEAEQATVLHQVRAIFRAPIVLRFPWLY